MYAKNVLLSLAFLPVPSIFVVAPSNFVQCVYCRPIRKFSQGQNDGPPWLNGKYASSKIQPALFGLPVKVP
jgi:hypothetical protein